MEAIPGTKPKPIDKIMNNSTKKSATPKMTVKLPRSKDDYCARFEGQYNHQPAYIEVDWENRTVCATYSGEVGGNETMSHLHGHEWHIAISPYAKCSVVRAIVREIGALAQEALPYYDVAYDEDESCCVASWLDRDKKNEFFTRMEVAAREASAPCW